MTVLIDGQLQDIYFNLVSGPISWSRKTLRAISLSSCEAEYKEAKKATKKTVRIRHVLTKLGLIQKSSTTLRCDNQSAIQLANNPVYHSKTKHIDLATHYIRDLVADGVITLEYCPTEKQAADIFTKSMTEAKFVRLRSLLGMREVVITGGC